MRISDWSSDVCSSDLIDIVERGLLVDARDPEFVLQTGPAGLAQLDVANVIFARLQIPRQACAHLSTRAEQRNRNHDVNSSTAWQSWYAGILRSASAIIAQAMIASLMRQIGRASCRERVWHYE